MCDKEYVDKKIELEIKSNNLNYFTKDEIKKLLSEYTPVSKQVCFAVAVDRDNEDLEKIIEELEKKLEKLNKSKP